MDKIHEGRAWRRSRQELIAEIGYCAFDRCPICLAPGPESREHVPQGAVGGHVRTLACAPCNNMLGTRAEGELTTDAGQFVLVVDGRVNPAVRDMRGNGQITLHVQPPDQNRYRLAPSSTLTSLLAATSAASPKAPSWT